MGAPDSEKLIAHLTASRCVLGRKSVWRQGRGTSAGLFSPVNGGSKSFFHLVALSPAQLEQHHEEVANLLASTLPNRDHSDLRIIHCQPLRP